jgi:hypothetical protein
MNAAGAFAKLGALCRLRARVDYIVQSISQLETSNTEAELTLAKNSS